MYRIAHHKQLSDETFLWDVEAPDVASSARPGQFIMLRLREGGERIPLTVADFDRERGTVTIVVQALGKTTREMMGRYKTGDSFLDFVGPLGLPAEVENVGHVVCVGGGLGVAPILPQLRAFKEAGNRTTAIVGFRNEERVFWEHRLAQWSDELIVCTDDGSYGRHGLVTAPLAELVADGERPQKVVAIGPLPMMRACAETTRASAVPTVVSLNAIMVDGTGMCGSCRVTVGGEIRFACVDGPDFDAHGVDFLELMERQRRFKRQEAHANEDWAHVCNLEKQLFEEEKRNYKKIKALRPTAVDMPERPPEFRVRSFDEVNLGYGLADALEEAERCIQCIKPKCIAGCPVSIDIPRFIRHLIVRDIDGALSVIQESNLFPSICGRVCPQESQCEAQCIIGKKLQPVAIGRLERFVGDHATGGGLRRAEKPAVTGSVAVVGSGPGGLACAADLAKQGIDVTVYEALHVAGGVLSYGIPAFRLPRDIIRRELDGLKRLGVTIETNKVVGRTFTVEQLMSERGFDAVFIATGAGYPRFLGIPGEAAGRVYSSNEFLTRVNLMGGDRFPYEDTPISIGDSVVVLGGGNTAMDCLRVARRIGASRVRCLYRRTEAEAPARIEELRHAVEEGITFHWLRSPLEIHTDDDGDVCAMTCQVMEQGEPDESGRRRPVAVEGEVERFDCDTVIYALGTRANPIIAQTTDGLETRWGGYIVADDETQATNLPGVFAGGDIVSGGATVILAMGAGRRAAAGIREYLETREWPEVAADVIEADATRELAPRACSRCGQDLTGDDDYLCCAESGVRWSCEGCGKVSEGFAFPYGLCPSCGGALTRGHSPDTADERAAEAVRKAFQIELGGRAFYRRAAEHTEDPELRLMLLGLVEMEGEHLAILADRYHLPIPDLATTLPALSALQIYAGADATPKTSAVELLQVALRLEERARDFFTEARAELEPGSPAERLYQELEAEEQEHVDLVATELRRAKAGKAGLLASGD